MKQKEDKLGRGFFLGVVILEHLVFILLMALAIAPKSSSGPTESTIKVEFILPEPTKQEPDVEIPVVIPDVRQISRSEELPQIHPTTNLRDYLVATQTESGLPHLRRTQASSQNSDRLSLGAPLTKGRSKGDFLDEPGGMIRGKPITTQKSYPGHSDRIGLPDGDSRRLMKTEHGNGTTGRLSPGNLLGVKTNRVSQGLPYEISGEASGRDVISGLDKPLQSEGKQGGGVHLSFKVRPDGSVFSVQIKPGRTTVGEVRLKEQARWYVEQIRFNALPHNSPQVVQSGEISINFTTRVNLKRL